MLSNVSLALILCVVLILVNSTLGKKNNLDREKLSPFECGFDPKSSARLPFSLRFYLIAVVFLIFDVEITLILPMPIMSSYTKTYPLITISLFFVLILLGGLFHEWHQGALDWDK